MKTFSALSIILFMIFCLNSCKNNSCGAIQTAAADTDIQSWEVIKGDTVNRTDRKGRKQGVWYILDHHKVKDTIIYKDDVVVE
jgi:hypothetical protein